MAEAGRRTERVDLAVVGMAASFPGAACLSDYWHGVIDGAPAEQGAPPLPAAPGGADATAALRSLTLGLAQAACEDAGYAARPPATERANPTHAGEPFAAASAPGEEGDWLASHLAAQFGLKSARLFVETPGSARPLADLKAPLEELRAGRCDVLLVLGGGFGGGALVLQRLADARAGRRVYALVKDVSVFGPESAGAGVGGDGAAARFDQEGDAGPDSVGLIGAALGDSAVTADEAFRMLARPRAARDEPLPRIVFDCTDARRGPCPAGVLGLIKAALALHDKVLPASGVALGPTSPAGGTPLYVNQSARPWIQGEGKGPRRASLYEVGQAGPAAHVLLEEHVEGAAPGRKLTSRHLPTELLCFSGESHSELLALVADVKATLLAWPEAPLSHLAYTLARREGGRHRLAVLASGGADLLSKLAAAGERLSRQERARWQLRNGTYYARLEGGEAAARVAFMFPGYGSYYPWMLADLCLHFPPVRAWFDTLDAVFDEADGPLPSQLLFPPRTGAAAVARETAESRLHGVRGGAQGGFTATLALHELLQNLGVRCDVMLGHSNGENAALIASGAMRFGGRRELFEVLRRVTAHDDEAASGDLIPKGVFLGVSGCEPDFISRLLDASAGRLHLAIDNCPHQVVLFGDEATVEDATARIKGAGGIALRLPFDRAYHTPSYEAQAERLRPVYDSINFGPAHTTLYSCATARPFPAAPDEIRALALRQWSSRVRFRETLWELYGEGVRTFVEVGPNSMLTGFVTDTLRDKEHLAVASNTQRLSGLEQLQRLLAQLYVGGMDLNLEYLFRFRHVEPLTLVPAAPARAAEQPPHAREEGDAAAGAPAVRAAPSGPAGNGKHSEGHARAADSSAGVPSAAAAGIPQPRGAHARAAVASPAIPTDARAAILSGHFELMQQFLASQSRVLAALFHGAGGAYAGAPVSTPAAAVADAPVRDAPEAWPLLGEVVAQDGRRLHCRRRFDLRRDPFLLDHTLGRREAGQHARFPPLPVVPFTVSMEILAEAAARLVGGGVVVGLRDVRGHRWLALERGELVLDVVAEAQSPPSAEGVDVRAQLFELGPGGQRQLSFEGLVRVARQYPPPPAPLLPPPSGARPVEVSAEDFYRDFAFHGPCFRGIRRLRAWDERSVEAEMEVPRTDTFFGAAAAPAFLTPAGLLDNTGQLVGLWLIERGERESAVFPFHAAGFEQYRSPHAAGSRLLCRAAVSLKGHATSEADFEFTDETNQVVARLRALQLKNSSGRHIPKILKPKAPDSYFSDPWLDPETGLACRRVDAATLGLLEGDKGVWKRALAHQSLDERERELWSGMPEEGARRAEWLAGRVAAKDAARQWAAERLGLALAPEEISIETDEAGRPFARCPAWGGRGAGPHISISYGDGHVLASAADAPAV